MASPKTRQTIQELRRKHGNNVRPPIDYLWFTIVCVHIGATCAPASWLDKPCPFLDVFRVRRAEPSVGVGDVRGLHMSGVLWEAPRAGSPQEVREEEGRDITLATTSCAFATSPSFVRSTTMDKWKDSELEKMKVTAHSVWWSPQADSPPSPSPPSLCPSR